jgi:hypothetical protein
MDKLATIELRFDRCRRVFRQARDERFLPKPKARSAVMVNEASKDGGTLSSITEYVTDQIIGMRIKF